MLNKKVFYMGEFESDLEVQVSKKGIFITDIALDDTIYIPNDKLGVFIGGLIEMKDYFQTQRGG